MSIFYFILHFSLVLWSIMTDYCHVYGVLRCRYGNRLVNNLNQSIMGTKAHKSEKELLVFKENSSIFWPKRLFCSMPCITMASVVLDLFFNLWHPSYVALSKSLVILRCPLWWITSCYGTETEKGHLLFMRFIFSAIGWFWAASVIN